MTDTLNQIKLTLEQQQSINFNSGDLLVKGAPGSGKSVVIMKRALKFNIDAIKNGQLVKIAIFTFANSLVNYTDEIMRNVLPEKNMIMVDTLDRYCIHLFNQMNHRRFSTMLSDDDRVLYVQQAMQSVYDSLGHYHRFFDVEPSFWADEFLWIKQKNITEYSQYESVERVGRGSKIRIERKERKLVFDMFTAYNEELQLKQKYDWEDMYLYLIKNKDSIPESVKFDYVLVDEAQDFSYAKLFVAKQLAKQSITIAADRAQKIYKTSFSWSELGIDIRGRSSKTLQTPFRSTRQIIQLASCLMRVNMEQSIYKDEYTDPIIPDIDGMVPVVMECKNDAEEVDVIRLLTTESLKTYDTVGILFRTRSELNSFRSILAHHHLSSQVIGRDNDWSLKSKGIKLSTLHSSKGLEFDVIIIPYFNDSHFPFSQALTNVDEEQLNDIMREERSVLYVGMTRAKNRLYLTYTPPVSSFLKEFDSDYYKYISAQGDALEKPAAPYKPAVGDKIKHPQYGIGEIKKLKTKKGVPLVEIDFESAGRKRVDLRYVDLEKVSL